jgi:GTP pyrophosphokinase
MELLADLLSTFKKYKRNQNLSQIKKAYLFAKEAHGSQMRHSGEPYIVHPVCVAKILHELGMDTQTIIAGLLHDVIEDTATTYDEIKKNFSEEVAKLVSGVTKLNTMTYKTKKENQSENVRKMFIAMAEDVRVIIIKLADRVHNMRTIKFVSEEKRLAKALETMEIYAPLAHRLGIRNIKEELENLSIKVMDPYACSEIEEYLAINEKARQTLLDSIKTKIENRLLGENIGGTVEARVKSTYGIYKKVYENNRQFEEIYDVYAIRIILDNEIECYNMLGIVHDMFTPIPTRFKDYISTPKSNLYRSIHTTVIERNAVPVEIQIRTWQMHHTAEYGIAAHWKYKMGLSGKNDKFEEGLAWIRQLLEAQQDPNEPNDLISSIKSDFLPEEVFVFTPAGDVKSLPKGATVIDFAYAIHTDIGHHAIGAKVDGRVVPFDYRTKTGEIIEIITNKKSKGPSRDWLGFTKTSEAQSKIRLWFKTTNKAENIVEGKKELVREFKKNLIALAEVQFEKFVTEIAVNHRFASVDEFYAAIGYGGLSLFKIMPGVKERFLKQYRLQESEPKDFNPQPRRAKRNNRVIVEGLEDCLTRIAKCCDPLPGDGITGFITRGHGISIHKSDCQNVTEQDEKNKSRWVNAVWCEAKSSTKFIAGLEVVSHSHPGMFVDIASKVSDAKLIMHYVDAKEISGQKNLMRFSISVVSAKQLNEVTESIEGLPWVISVRRIPANFLED